MGIKSVKVTMSRIGIHTVDKPKATVRYMPMAKISYIEEGKASKEVFLDMVMVKKSHFKGWIIGLTFFAGITADGYQIYNEDGERTGFALKEEVGQVIQANENDFICMKDGVANLIGKDGSISRSRKLTEEELKMIQGDGKES